MKKNIEFSNCSKYLSLISEKTRLAILTELIEGEKSVGQINETLQIEPTLLSKHLKALKELDVLQVQLNGKERIYKINSDFLSKNHTNEINFGCCSVKFNV